MSKPKATATKTAATWLPKAALLAATCAAERPTFLCWRFLVIPALAHTYFAVNARIPHITDALISSNQILTCAVVTGNTLTIVYVWNYESKLQIGWKLDHWKISFVGLMFTEGTRTNNTFLCLFKVWTRPTMKVQICFRGKEFANLFHNSCQWSQFHRYTGKCWSSLDRLHCCRRLQNNHLCLQQWWRKL